MSKREILYHDLREFKPNLAKKMEEKELLYSYTYIYGELDDGPHTYYFFDDGTYMAPSLDSFSYWTIKHGNVFWRHKDERDWSEWETESENDDPELEAEWICQALDVDVLIQEFLSE